MDILLKRPLKFIPVWRPECRITLPVCLTSLFLSWWVWDFDIFETSLFLSPFELGRLVRCDLLHACSAAPTVVSVWRCNSTAGHSIITASSAVSLNQPRVSRIDFFWGGGGFPPQYDAVTCGTFYFNIICHLKWYISNHPAESRSWALCATTQHQRLMLCDRAVCIGSWVFFVPPAVFFFPVFGSLCWNERNALICFVLWNFSVQVWF